MRVASFFTSIALSCVAQGLALNPVARRSPWGVGMTTFTTGDICGTSSFDQEASLELALVADCQELLKRYASDRDYGFEFFGWDKDHLNSPYLDLGTIKTCSLVAKPLDANDGPAIITFGDAADIVQDAIAKLSAGDQVGGSGVMDCQATKDTEQVSSWKGGFESRKFSWKLAKPGSVPIIDFGEA